ncbi:hypothetical protein KLP40_06130 [Hymenobacter sp. NST-14]|nr:hypothetical protein [Hymenobacter piscis]MBT9392735.1 hypothetical protein [Hymenobacter piscis]
MQRFSTLFRFIALLLLLVLGAANRPRPVQQSSLSDDVSALLRTVTIPKG